MSEINSYLKEINFSQICFLQSAPSVKTSPIDSGKEVAFVGRSNGGKSSAINAICNRKKLAKISKTPGHTQMINYFDLKENRRLVDLPGYGYAKIPQKVHKQIENILGSYLSLRQSLTGLILLMDIRHPLTNSDQQMLEFALNRNLSVHILLTKSDKLKKNAENNALRQVQAATQHANDLISVQTFSALKLIGIDEARDKLSGWFDG